jgi:hypothetical protein
MDGHLLIDCGASSLIAMKCQDRPLTKPVIISWIIVAFGDEG